MYQDLSQRTTCMSLVAIPGRSQYLLRHGRISTTSEVGWRMHGSTGDRSVLVGEARGARPVYEHVYACVSSAPSFHNHTNKRQSDLTLHTAIRKTHTRCDETWPDRRSRVHVCVSNTERMPHQRSHRLVISVESRVDDEAWLGQDSLRSYTSLAMTICENEVLACSS